MQKRHLNILMMFFLILIGINSGCFLQPRVEIKRELHILGTDAPAVRLGKSVKGEIWAWNFDKKKWELKGEQMIPAGTYLKFKKPKDKIEDVLKEENIDG